MQPPCSAVSHENKLYNTNSPSASFKFSLVTVVWKYSHTCVCDAYTSHSYYSRAAFILLKASDCAATNRRWCLFKEMQYSQKNLRICIRLEMISKFNLHMSNIFIKDGHLVQSIASSTQKRWRLFTVYTKAKDAFSQLPTTFGKWVCYEVLPFDHKLSECWSWVQGMVAAVVVLPLLSLTIVIQLSMYRRWGNFRVKNTLRFKFSC